MIELEPRIEPSCGREALGIVFVKGDPMSEKLALEDRLEIVIGCVVGAAIILVVGLIGFAVLKWAWQEVFRRAR